MKIFFLHGRAQEMFEEDELRRVWIHTFKKGLEASNITESIIDDDIIFPYYGKVLEQLINDYKMPPIEGIIQKGGYVSDKEMKFFHDFLLEVASSVKITSNEIKQNFDSEIIERGALNWKWVQAILRTVDKRGNWGVKALKKFTYDVFLYLTVPAIRNEIDNFVSNKISNEPTVIIGHSLGSIICYNVLTSHPEWSITKFITVGSPLGLNAVKKYLGATIQMPLCVKNGWYNAYDFRDVVALNPLDEKHFRTIPSIYNNGDVENQTENRHGIIGYLNDKDVAKTIWDATK